MYIICHSSSAAGCCLRFQTSLREKKGDNPNCFECSPFVGSYYKSSLSTEAKLLNDSSVSLDVNSLEIIKDTTTLTYKLKK